MSQLVAQVFILLNSLLLLMVSVHGEMRPLQWSNGTAFVESRANGTALRESRELQGANYAAIYSYAQKYCNVNPQQVLCAEFVSRSLHAGGYFPDMTGLNTAPAVGMPSSSKARQIAKCGMPREKFEEPSIGSIAHCRATVFMVPLPSSE